jgi:pimeloyl-ACP methyl ester carboxylesterase
VKGLAGPETCIARSRGYAISYEDAGQGSPVVLVPGLMGSAFDCRQAGYIEGLATSRRVLVVDPLGHGKSDKPHEAEAYAAPDVAADVIAVMDAAGVERAALWGYSWGAWLACMAAVEFPQRFNALILGGVGLSEPWTGVPPWADALARSDWAACWSLFQHPLSPEAKLHFEEVNDPIAVAAVVKGGLRSAYVFHLGRVSVPTLVYVGSDDNPDGVMPTARELKTELQVLEGCDHFGAFSEVDRVMPLAVAFLKTTASG